MSRGRARSPARCDSPHRDLIFRKGEEHEAAYLARLEAEGRSVVRIPTYDDEGFDQDEARRLTEEAIRVGFADVIYQPYLENGRWRGFADFLERQPDGPYEPVDTKLARSAKPAHVLQLCFYAEQVARIQGAPVERIHVENGRGERETLRVAEFEAYYRRVRERFLAALDRRDDTYPWPCDHCGICDFRRLCREQLDDDDHLMLVAGMRRGVGRAADRDGGRDARGARLAAGERRRPPATGAAGDASRASATRPSSSSAARVTGEHCWSSCPTRRSAASGSCPRRTPGDVWLDLEGHPFYETARGLEYLFGCCYRDDAGEVVYEALWGTRPRRRAARLRAVRRLARRAAAPVPGHARLPLRRLRAHRADAAHGRARDARARGRRAPARRGARRPLPRRQASRSAPRPTSYSIKAIEKLYGFVRDRRGRRAATSRSSRFEEWLETGDESLLDDVERYNEEDCRSTVELHEWLLSIRPPDVPWRAPPEQRAPKEEAVERDAERAALARAPARGRRGGRRRGGCSATSSTTTSARQRPQWWAWFRWPQLDDDELSRTAPRSAASLGRHRARGRGQEPRVPDDLPAAGAQARSAEGFDPDDRRSGSGSAWTTTHGIVTLLRSTTGRTSRCRAG